MSFDYAELKRQMNVLAQAAAESPEKLNETLPGVLSSMGRLPPECAGLIFWGLTFDLDFNQIAPHFDWYCLHDVYQKLAVEHEDMPRVILSYLRRHPSVESEELADFLWFAWLYRLAVQNAWQLSYVERLEMFQAFVENMTVYAAHTIQPEAWNDEDVYLFTPELRLVYHVSQAYACLEREDRAGYARYLDLAAEDCPDLCGCVEALKEIPSQEESPLTGMTREEIQAYALQRVSEIKKAFQNENWLRTAELVKTFDRDGFEATADFELLNIQCQLAQRGLLW